MLERKRAVTRCGIPTKKDWLLISSKEGKGLEVKQEDRAKIVAWVRAHPDVVGSSLKHDSILGVAIQHDSTEALKIECQKEVQSMSFGGNVSALIEGCTCHFPCPDDETKILFDFHFFLSDDLQQMASTVDNRMKKLVKSLKDRKILKVGVSESNFPSWTL